MKAPRSKPVICFSAWMIPCSRRSGLWQRPRWTWRKAAATTSNAALATAQANYDLALNAARLASAATRTSDWRAVEPGRLHPARGVFQPG